MKKIFIILLVFGFVMHISSCKKEDKEDVVVEPEAGESYDLLIYDTYNKSDYYDNKLQATIKKSDFQFSTFSENSYGNVLGSFDKVYVYNTLENTESFMLIDDNGEPAFLYKIDMATGQKKESIIEIEKQDANSFYVRFFYYDWQNRLGTLLFETLVTKNGDEYVSSPTFVIDDINFGSKSSIKDGKKSNTSFPVRIGRLEKMMAVSPVTNQLKSTNDGIDEWMTSFNQLKNSTISDWLVKTRKAGAVLTLAGLGLSETIIAAPVGVWLMAGGSTLIVASTAIEVVTTDKWSQFLTETQGKMDVLTESATKIGDNMVSKFEGYSHDLKDHWVNTNTNKTSLDELTSEINESEMLVNKNDLNDLPNKDGVLQIGLSWDTQDTDVDLWVTDPSGEKLYYGNPNTASGGYLDRDDTDGIGPENIYWVENIPDGDYLIQVHYFGGDVPTNYSVTVTNGLGFSQTYNGNLAVSDQLDNVVTIHKSGININK